jgi:hypothetical protein
LRGRCPERTNFQPTTRWQSAQDTSATVIGPCASSSTRSFLKLKLPGRRLFTKHALSAPVGKKKKKKEEESKEEL